MSDYTKSTNFATKDALSSGNALKIVKGTEIDTEFNNIATAIATKADLASPTFTGTPTLPTGTIGVTQSTSDDSTKLATTAFVQDIALAIKQEIYPVGSIYTNSSVSTNPATLLGFGTWTAFGAGKTIIGNGGGYTAGNTGGSADAITVSHTHTASVSDSGHQHNIFASASSSSGTLFNITNGFSTTTPNAQAQATAQTTTTGIGVSISTTGSSGTGANLPPYIVVYLWQRTA